MTLSLRPAITRHEVELIHERSLDLLERTGIVYSSPEALKFLEDAGCEVDRDRLWASVPRDLVEWALQQCSRVVRLCARDPDRDVVLDGRRPHHTTESQGSQAIDIETGERRLSTTDDLRRAFLFADALDMVGIANVMVAATDAPPQARTAHHFAAGFAQTGKHVRTGVNHPGLVPFIVDLAKAALGGEFRPIFSVVYCPLSPLVHDGPTVEAAIKLVEYGVPMLVYPMALAGGTAPISPAGSILQHNIEVLSGIVLFQLVSPGAPMIYGAGPSQLDMATGIWRGNATGESMRMAQAEMARFYNLPVNLGGMGTSSNDLDALYGYHACTSLLLSYLAGADEIYNMGLLGSEYLSLDKMVLDNHLTREIEIMVGPVLVDDQHLQAEVIERVGSGGHYMGQRETRQFTRSEYVPPWPPVGEDMMELVHREALQILQSHEPPPLPPGAADEIETILAAVDRELA